MHTNAPRSIRVEAIFHFVALGCAIAILLAPQIIPPCGGRLTLESTNHHCNGTLAVVTGLAFLAVVVTIGSWFLQNRPFRIVFAGLLSALALGVLALPQSWALGICRSDDMACHQTALATSLPALVLLVVAIARLTSAIRNRVGHVQPTDPWDGIEPLPPKAVMPANGRRKCCG